MRLHSIVVVFALSLMIFGAPNAAFAESPGSVQNGVSNLNMNKVHLGVDFAVFAGTGSLGDIWLLAAFIPTDSKSRACLSGINYIFPANEVDLMWCGFRNHPIYGPGLSVQVMFHPGFNPTGTYEKPVEARLTVIQDGAIHYGDPIPDVP